MRKLLSVSAVPVLVVALLTTGFNSQNVKAEPVPALQPKDVCQYNSGNQDYGDYGGETTHYKVLICSNNSRTYYFGTDKRDGISIGVKGTQIKPGEKYIFRNGKYTYTVTKELLTITKNGKVVLKEKFLNGGLYLND